MTKKQTTKKTKKKEKEMDDTPTEYQAPEDFDVEEEFLPMPLIAEGFYNGAVTDVKYNSEDLTVDWTVTLAENGGVMSDGETPIDGSTHLYRNWLPKPGDENERTKKGTQTKRQAKINMLHDFSEGMKATMTNPRVILESIANSDWLGIAVQAKVGVRTWEGRTFNSIERMVAV